VASADSLFDLRIADDQEPPSLHVSPARRTNTYLQDLSHQFIWHRRIERVLRMISKRSVVLAVSSGIAYPL
jgi:hypothetical protein